MIEPEKVSSREAKARGYDPATIERLRRDEGANAEALALIPDIEAAFDGVARPRITLSLAKGFDDEWELSDERLAELSARDPEQTWQEVPDESIEERQEYFTFSDAEGWRFYLPAYLVHYLRRFPDCGWGAVVDACINKNHVDFLNEAQLRCVDQFVDLWRNHGQ